MACFQLVTFLPSMSLPLVAAAFLPCFARLAARLSSILQIINHSVLIAESSLVNCTRLRVAFLALHDLECVDLPLQLSGVDQAPQDVVVEVSEPQRDPAQVLEPAVDGLDRAVGRPDIEIGQHILTPTPQGAPQLGKLLQTGGQSLTQA